MMHRVLGNILCDLDLAKGQNLFFLVNAPPPKLLDQQFQTLQVHKSHTIEGTEYHFV